MSSGVLATSYAVADQFSMSRMTAGKKLLELIRLLQEMDYSLCWHLPLFFNPENYFREPDNEF